MFGNSKTKKAKNNKTQHIPENLSQSIPYKQVYQNGVIEIRDGVFSRTYELPSANFRTCGVRQQQVMAETYGAFIGSFDSDIDVEVTIYNKTVDIMQFQNEVMVQMRNDGLDKYRVEYNNMLLDKMTGAKNNLESVLLLTISFEAENIDRANERFRQLSSNISEYTRQLTKQTAKELSIIERLEILNSIYNQDSSIPLYQKRMIDGHEVESFSLENCAAQGITTKDVIAPSGMAFRSNDITIGSTLARSYYISNYPTWLKANVLPNLASLPTNMLVSAYFKTIPQDEAIKMVKRQGTNISSSILENQKNAAKRGFDASLISPELQVAKEETDELMEDMTRENNRLFVANIVITIFAPNETALDDFDKKLKMISNKTLTTIKPLNMLMEQGFNSSLPLGNYQLDIQRLMTTNTVSAVIPLDVKEIRQKTGMYYGLNAASGSLILHDKSTDFNANSCILGMPGAGKSFSAKREMLNVLLNTDDEVYVIDPEGIDYTPMAEAFNGSIIKMAAGSNVYVNPFDLNITNADDNGDPVKVKNNFIDTICEIAIGGRYGLDPVQKTMIGRCVCEIYEPYIKYLKETGKDIDVEKAPTMVDFYNALMRQPNDNAQYIAISLERFVKGSLDIFSHHTNVSIDNRFTVYNIRDIGPGLKELGLQICLDNIWNKMIENHKKGKRTWFYIDEFYLMMQKPTSASYIAEIWKRARKWNGIPTAITQNVEDMLKSEEARTIINNCSFLTILGQTPINKQQLSEMLDISIEEQKYINSAKPGMGLLRIGNDIIPMDDSFPKNTMLYSIMTTKPGEGVAGKA